MTDENDLIHQLRAAGHRLTPQRRLVLQVLQHSHHHISADEIARSIEQEYPALAIDHATIYRTLKWLRDARLISETSLGDNRMVYALLSHHDHHHLVCESCRNTFEADPEIFATVRNELERRYGFEAHLHHLAIFGLCRDCRA